MNRFRKTLATLTVLAFAIVAFGCWDEGSKKYDDDFGQKDYESKIDKVFKDSDQASDWTMTPELRVVEPHGDGDGDEDGGAATSYEQTYYERFQSKKVDGFEMYGFVKVPPDDTVSFEKRTSGYLELQTQRVEDLPESEGFMRLVVAEYRSLALINIVQDGTMAEKYPGKMVYRLIGPERDHVPTTSKQASPDYSEADDWHKVFSEVDNSKGSLVGYDPVTRKWTALTYVATSEQKDPDLRP